MTPRPMPPVVPIRMRRVTPSMSSSSATIDIDGVPMPEVDFSGALPPDSNLRPVLPTIRKVNINTRLPQYLEFLAQDLQGRGLGSR